MVHISRATTLSEKGNPYPKAPPRNTNLQLDAGSRTNAQSKDRPEATSRKLTHTQMCDIKQLFSTQRVSVPTKALIGKLPKWECHCTHALDESDWSSNKQLPPTKQAMYWEWGKKSPPPLLGRITPNWGRFPEFGNLGCIIGSGSQRGGSGSGSGRGNP